MPISEGLALGISAASSLIGGGISAAGAASANRRGERLAKWQMAQQRQEAAINRSWQERQTQKWFDAENAYNNIGAQRARARASGANPDLVDVSGYNASASVGSGAQAEPNTSFQYQNEGSQLGSSISQSGYNAINAANQSQQIINQTKETSAAIEQMKSSVMNLSFDSDLKKQSFEWIRDTWEMNMKLLNNSVRQSYIKTTFDNYTALNAKYQAFSSIYNLMHVQPLQSQAIQQGIDESVQRIALMASEGKLNLQQITHLINQDAQGWSQLALLRWQTSINQGYLNLENEYQPYRLRNSAADSALKGTTRWNMQRLNPLVMNQIKVGTKLTLEQMKSYQFGNTLEQNDMRWKDTPIGSFLRQGRYVYDNIGGYANPFFKSGK